MALTYVLVREDLAYRLDGQVARATAPEFSKDPGVDGAAVTCHLKYQFFAYSDPHQGQIPFPCSARGHIEHRRQLQVEYLVSNPDRTRYYPTQNNFELIALGGLGLGGLWLLLSGFLFVRGFLRKKL